MIDTVPTREFRHEVTGHTVRMGRLNLVELKAPSGDTTVTLAASHVLWDGNDSRQLVLETRGTTVSEHH